MKLKKEHFIELKEGIELPMGTMLIPMCQITGDDKDTGIVILPKTEEDYKKIMEKINEKDYNKIKEQLNEE